MGRANPQNLIPIRSEDEAREKGKKGGKKSGETRRKKKAMKDMMQIILSLKVPDNISNNLKQLGIEDEDLNIQSAILLKQAEKALKGDLSAVEFCRDVAGENNKNTDQPSGKLEELL